jgi:hypothetical protein
LDLATEADARAERELARMIEKRSPAKLGETDPVLEEPGYVESVRRYRERERREMRARWFIFHSDMSELHARLSREHAQKAERLCEDPRPEQAP